MTPAQFKAWRKRLGLNQKKAGAALGLHPRTISLYERGKRFEDGRPVAIPKAVQLAMVAIALGIKDYPDTE